MITNTDFTIKRTDASNTHFKELVLLLDQELAVRDGEDHDFYHQFNLLDDIKYTIVGYMGDFPVACGAIKAYDNASMEVKRMYTKTDFRGKGIASKVLHALEKWAKELNYERCILETGLMQPEAIALYKKNGYTSISNYGQYVGVENSVCFEKGI